jgi:hypothetical protein
MLCASAHDEVKMSLLQARVLDQIPLVPQQPTPLRIRVENGSASRLRIEVAALSGGVTGDLSNPTCPIILATGEDRELHFLAVAQSAGPHHFTLQTIVRDQDGMRVTLHCPLQIAASSPAAQSSGPALHAGPGVMTSGRKPGEPIRILLLGADPGEFGLGWWKYAVRRNSEQLLAASPQTPLLELLDRAMAKVEPTSLDLRGEFSKLQEEINSASTEMHRPNKLFQYAVQLGASLTDLRKAVAAAKPHWVHFAGHGSKEGIYLRSDVRNAKESQARCLLVEDIGPLFATGGGKEQIELVTLNACDSEQSAHAIAKDASIPYVIGMQRAINDDAAIKFSSVLYMELAMETRMEDAFDGACAALREAERSRSIDAGAEPVLFVRGERYLPRRTRAPRTSAPTTLQT